MHVVKEIIVYPVKGLKGISLASAQALTEGFEHDRRWMLINADGKFLSQREHAIMALFNTQLQDEGVLVSYKDKSTLIPFGQHLDEHIKVTVWNSKFKAQEVDKTISSWFSDQLQMEVQLVTMTEISKRYKRLFTKPFSTHVSFADGYPYLILGEESLEFLNEKLESKVAMDRFRANIIVSSDKAHEEDDWEEFTLSDTRLKVIKPCARCQVVTIDQQTAEVGLEPLKTLSTYRKKANKIYFGANVIVLEEGTISVGDKLIF